MNRYVFALCEHALQDGLVCPEDRTWAVNSLLQVMRLDAIEPAEPVDAPLHEILDALTEDAVKRGLCDDNQVARDLFDTKLMGALTPAPREVRAIFRELYSADPVKATDWFINSRRIPITSAVTASPRIKSGSTKVIMARWILPSICPSRKGSQSYCGGKACTAGVLSQVPAVQ